MGGELPLELPGIVRRPARCFGIAVIERQRIIGERDASDVGGKERKLLRGKRREPSVERPGADRAREDEDFRPAHAAGSTATS